MSAVTEIGLFQLAIDLVRLHESASDKHTTLVFVVDSHLERNQDLYAALLRRIQGAYISVDNLEQPTVRGRLDEDLANLLIEGLRTSALGLDIKILQKGSEVAVQTAKGTVPENPSERLLLSFFAALFSDKLFNHSVAAIAWSEARLEWLAKDTLWQLIRTLLGHYHSWAVKTLIFIAGARPDAELHCEHPDHSVRYALTEQGLAKRKTRVSLEAAVGKLTRHPERPFVLFLGAGASASARMPLGNAVRDYALERFFGDSSPPAVYELALRFHKWIVENDRLLVGEVGMSSAEFVDRLTLERVLLEEFRLNGREESPTLRHLKEKNKYAVECRETRVRKSLREISVRSNRLVIVTVNFDTILEAEFKDEIRVFATPGSFSDAEDYIARYLTEGGPIPILKLHGTLDEPASIVADVDTRSLGLPPAAKQTLQQLCGLAGSQTPWVYVGASMRDPDVAEVLGATDFSEGLDEWWVSPFPDPAVDRFVNEHRATRWHKAGRAGLSERQITETADVFLSYLAREWKG